MTLRAVRGPLLGIIGKPNSGKSTFFNAATLQSVPMASYPFTTITPNVGIGHVRVECQCKKLGVQDRPVNSVCIEGNRFVPIKMVDVAGLVPGAHAGRGLGNKFLDELRQADILVHVIDASGATDEEGRIVPAGSHDPIRDVIFVEREIDLWIKGLLERDWQRISRLVETKSGRFQELLAKRLSGLGIGEVEIAQALHATGLDSSRPGNWRDEDLMKFICRLRQAAKPIIIAANKIDIPEAKPNLERLKHTGRVVIPCAAEAELLLRRAAHKGLIKYLPGDPTFEVTKNSQLTEEQLKALERVNELVLKPWKGTGVQQVINTAFRDLMRYIVVYPVEDDRNLADKKGNVLPDAILIAENSTARDLAYRIHTELGETFLYAIDAKTGRRMAADEPLKDGDVVKIVSAAKRV